MRNPFLCLAVMLICPSLVLADAVVFDDGSRDDLDKMVDVNGPEQKELAYAQLSLRVYNGNIANLEFSPEEKDKSFVIPLLEKEAEASLPSTDEAIRDFLAAHATIQDAVGLKEIQPVVSNDYYKKLSEKTEAGIKEQVVLQMTQNLRPATAEVRDVRVSGESVKIIAQGNSYLGAMNGLIQMDKSGGQWIIADESWFIGGSEQRKHDGVVADVFTATKEDFVQDRHQAISLERQIEPEFSIKKRELYKLRKVNAPKHKNAFTYTFFMESKNKKEADNDPEEELVDDRKRLHILWTGPKELVPEQKLYHTTYPLDVSVARDDDGYLPGEFNLMLPEKKPNTFLASFLYSF